MKREEKDLATQLRKEGMAMNEIAKKVGVSKSSVSLWVRDVPLTKEQRNTLNKNGFSTDVIEKRRTARITNTRNRRRVEMDGAKTEIRTISKQELFLIGVALYWGEGGKTERSMARIANADPLIIKFMMRFFREVCEVPEAKFRGHVHTFSHLNAKKAEEYWSDIAGISRSQFFKTYSKPSIASKNKKDSLPYGTFQIYVCDTKLFYRIKGWIERLGEIGLTDTYD